MSAPRDPVAPYRSAVAVSVRVDAAWNRGFEAGHDDLLRRFGLVAVVAVFGFMRARKLPPFIVGFVTMLTALVVVPVAVGIFAARRGARALAKHRAKSDVLVPGQVVLDDGSVF